MIVLCKIYSSVFIAWKQGGSDDKLEIVEKARHLTFEIKNYYHNTNQWDITPPHFCPINPILFQTDTSAQIFLHTQIYSPYQWHFAIQIISTLKKKSHPVTSATKGLLLFSPPHCLDSNIERPIIFYLFLTQPIMKWQKDNNQCFYSVTYVLIIDCCFQTYYFIKASSERQRDVYWKQSDGLEMRLILH